MVDSSNGRLRADRLFLRSDGRSGEEIKRIIPFLYIIMCFPVFNILEECFQLAEATWWTMILKLIDLSETVVFVLRKKTNQISFLHVYHHVTTLSFTWVSAKYFAGGMCTFSILVNSIVHVIMYSYYFLSARGPKTRALVSLIKPYITIIQMASNFQSLSYQIFFPFFSTISHFYILLILLFFV